MINDDTRKFDKNLFGLIIKRGSARLTIKLKNYWDFLRRDKSFPNLNDIQPELVKDLWNQSILIKADNSCNEEKDYKILHVGNSLRQSFLNDFDESAAIGMRLVSDGKIFRIIDSVLSSKTYVEDIGEIYINNKCIKYRQILLPFGENGITVKAILCGISYKIFEANEK